MPAASGSPTQASTSATTVVELESVESSQFKNGDLAWVSDLGVMFRADFASTATRNGTTVLYMRNSNPAYGGLAAGATPGRWIPEAESASALSVFAKLTADTAIVTPGPGVLLSTAALVAPAAGIMDVSSSVGAFSGPNTAALGFQLEASINGGAFAVVSDGGSGIAALANQSGSAGFTGQLAVAKGDSVVFRVSGRASAAAASIGVVTRPAFDQLTIRARFFST